jgi:hypothetical protein
LSSSGKNRGETEERQRRKQRKKKEKKDEHWQPQKKKVPLY